MTAGPSFPAGASARRQTEGSQPLMNRRDLNRRLEPNRKFVEPGRHGPVLLETADPAFDRVPVVDEFSGIRERGRHMSLEPTHLEQVTQSACLTPRRNGSWAEFGRITSPNRVQGQPRGPPAPDRSSRSGHGAASSPGAETGRIHHRENPERVKAPLPNSARKACGLRNGLAVRSAPRAHGDEPNKVKAASSGFGRSPCSRGWSRPLLRIEQHLDLLPAPADGSGPIARGRLPVALRGLTTLVTARLLGCAPHARASPWAEWGVR